MKTKDLNIVGGTAQIQNLQFKPSQEFLKTKKDYTHWRKIIDSRISTIQHKWCPEYNAKLSNMWRIKELNTFWDKDKNFIFLVDSVFYQYIIPLFVYNSFLFHSFKLPMSLYVSAFLVNGIMFRSSLYSLIHLAILCFTIGIFRPYILKVIIDIRA